MNLRLIPFQCKNSSRVFEEMMLEYTLSRVCQIVSKDLEIETSGNKEY